MKEKAMTTKNRYVRARPLAKLTPGESVRVARELQEMSQTELAEASGISQTEISAIERGRSTLGVDRAKKLATALHVHPAVLLFADWDVEEKTKRATG